MKQTSIQWLIEQLLAYGDKAFNKEITLGEYHIKKQELIEQAKEMHKEEIEQAYKDGWNAGDFGSDEWAKIYYKELYEQ